MPSEATSKETSPAVALFQKAHQKMVMLQRLDEQIGAIMEQRRRIQDELREVQTHINEEFDRVMKAAAENPAKLLGAVFHDLKGGNGQASRISSVEEAA